MLDSQRAPEGGRPETALVVSLGKSHGASTVAVGLALVGATELGSEVLLAELDPRGGELVEQLFFRGRPTTASEVSVPAGARELADRLSGLDLDFAPDSEATLIEEIDLCHEFTIKLKGLDHLSVILGDPLVGVAARAANAVTPRLKRMASYEGFDTVVIDGGRWDSGQAGRLQGVDIVYAVVEANSTSQLHRCLAEMQALWNELQGVRTANRMVVVLSDLAWAEDDVVALFCAPPGMSERTAVPYRVAALEFNSRRENRAVALIREGRWRLAADVRDGLAPFRGLASVMVDLSYDAPETYNLDDEGEEVPPVEEFPYLSDSSPAGLVEDVASGDPFGPEPPAPSHGHVAYGSGRAVSDNEDPALREPVGDEWPFADFGEEAGAWIEHGSGTGDPHHPAEFVAAGPPEERPPVPPAPPVRTARSVEQRPDGKRDEAAPAHRPPPPVARPELAPRPGPARISGGEERCVEGADAELSDSDHGEPSPAIQAALAVQPTVPPHRFRSRRREES